MKKLSIFSICILIINIANSQTHQYQWGAGMGGIDLTTLGLQTQESAVDDSGYVYTTGRFNGLKDFDSGPNIFNLSSDSSMFTMFIAKHDKNGNFLWAKKIAGLMNSSATPTTMDVDAHGNIYLGGSYGGTVDFNPDSAAAYNLSSTYGSMFILKLDQHGTFKYAYSFGVGTTTLQSLRLDELGNIYFTGYIPYQVDFDITTSYYSLNASNAFIVKLDSNAHIIWGKQIATGGYPIRSVTIGKNNNIYVNGYFLGNNIDFDPGVNSSYLSSNSGTPSTFILKLDTAGNFMWVNRQIMYVSSNNYFTSIALDKHDNVYVTGQFKDSIRFNESSANGYSFAIGMLVTGNKNGYLVKYNSLGLFKWQVRLGGVNNNATGGEGVTVDTNNNVFYVGTFKGFWTDFDPDPVDTFMLNASQYYQGSWWPFKQKFVCELDSNGHFISAGQILAIQFNWMHTDKYNNVYIGGLTSGGDLDPGPVDTGVVINNENDIFVSKLVSCSPINSSVQINPPYITAIQNNASYQWIMCPNSIINGATNQNLLPTSNGSYAVVINLNGCSDTSNCINYTVTNSIEYKQGKAVTIFPNPTEDIISVKSKTTLMNNRFLIYDSFGNMIIEDYFKNDLINSIPIVHLRSGTYLLQIVDGTTSKNYPFIKK